MFQSQQGSEVGKNLTFRHLESRDLVSFSSLLVHRKGADNRELMDYAMGAHSSINIILDDDVV